MLGVAMLACAFLVAPPSPTSAQPSPRGIDRAWPVDTRGDGCAAPVWPSDKAARGRNRVLVIGDSMVRNAQPDFSAALSKAGWAPTVRCWGAKGTDWGVQQVERARSLGQLPNTLVISLGINDIWWLHIPMDTAVEQMMAAIGSKRQVYWINLYFGPNGYDDLPSPVGANRVLRDATLRYPNLKIINFAKQYREALANDPNLGWDDGVHLNSAGDRERTRIIISSIGSGWIKDPEPAPAG